jgi:Ni/Fe-hydrogenase subunit HybB-like protein
LFGLEILLLAVPMILMFQRSVRWNPSKLYGAAVMVLFGFIANRLNVSVTGMEAGSGTHYVPRWTEIAVTLAIIALGFAFFRVIAQYFPIFEEHHTDQAHAGHSIIRERRAAESVPAGVG